MTDKKRCEPPEELRDKDRLVCWLRRSDDEQMLAIWRTGPVPFWNIFDSDSEYLPDGWLAFEGWRFYTTVTTPDTVAALVEALEWMIANDDTNEGDTPLPEHGNRTWNEINEYWIDGLNKARAVLALYRKGTER